MIFNSLFFLFFFGVFFVLYWFIFQNNLKAQNILLLIASYVFYAWSDWYFLYYLIGISVLNFFLGIYIEKTSNSKYKQWLLYIGLIQGVGGLAFFKYYNFFIDSFKAAFHSIGINFDLQTLNIIIPLGISFFTFRTISYLLDIHKGKIQASRDWVVFFNYVSFFPSLVSGPIDKAKKLIPQLENKRIFKSVAAADGMRQILWGLFKKVVIADNCAKFTNQIFEGYQSASSFTLILGAFFYAIQLYADFSGYSDMAIGIARLMGFEITRNFEFPFFSQNIAEFWRKWHMSLTNWLTEYVFTPLSISFRNLGKLGLIFAIVINFTICGIWHGANWTYVLFGFLHGCYFIPLIISGTMNKKKKMNSNKFFPSFKEFINIAMTFLLVMFTFIIFRAQNIETAYRYIFRLFSKIFQSPGEIFLYTFWKQYIILFILIIFFLLLEWIGKTNQYAIAKFIDKWHKSVRWSFYYVLIISVFYFAQKGHQFIYFQF